MPTNPLNCVKVIGRGWFNIGLTLESILHINDWKLFGSFGNFRQWSKRIRHLSFIYLELISVYQFDLFTSKIGVLQGLLQGINSPCSFKFSMMGFNPSSVSGFSGHCFRCGHRQASLSLIKTGTAFLLDPQSFRQPTLQDLHSVQLMGEKEQAPYLWKQEAWTLLSIFLPRRGEGECSRIRDSWEKQQSPSRSLKGDWNSSVGLVLTVPLQWWIRRKAEQASASTEKSAPVSKTNRLIGPPQLLIPGVPQA